MNAITLPPLDREAASLPEDHLALRLWLRMLTCTLLIEKTITGRLKTDFAQSLARFDLLSQLHRHHVFVRSLSRENQVDACRPRFDAKPLDSRANGVLVGVVDHPVREFVVDHKHPRQPGFGGRFRVVCG